jgi:hypothetical protein
MLDQYIKIGLFQSVLIFYSKAHAAVNVKLIDFPNFFTLKVTICFQEFGAQTQRKTVYLYTLFYHVTYIQKLGQHWQYTNIFKWFL